jgi:hypothetical protein
VGIPQGQTRMALPELRLIGGIRYIYRIGPLIF